MDTTLTTWVFIYICVAVMLLLLSLLLFYYHYHWFFYLYALVFFFFFFCHLTSLVFIIHIIPYGYYLWMYLSNSIFNDGFYFVYLSRSGDIFSEMLSELFLILVWSEEGICLVNHLITLYVLNNNSFKVKIKQLEEIYGIFLVIYNFQFLFRYLVHLQRYLYETAALIPTFNLL